MKRLDKKVALVTGGTKGIGAAIAQRFVHEGATVKILGRSEKEGNELCQVLSKKYGNAASFEKCDMRIDDDLERCVTKTLIDNGKIDILINNAGIFPPTPFLQTSQEELNEVVRINQTGLFLITQLSAKAMAQAGSGCIINVSSIQGIQGFPLQAHYSATKGASIAMTRALAAELGHLGIRVNAIAPGAIMTETLKKNIPIEFTDIIARQTPLMKLATESDVANCAVFLASDEAKALSGQIICVDGGYSSCRMLG